MSVLLKLYLQGERAYSLYIQSVYFSGNQAVLPSGLITSMVKLVVI